MGFQNYEADIGTWTSSACLLPRLIEAGNSRGVSPCFISDAMTGLERDGGIIDELTYDLWIVAHDDDRHRPEVRQVIEKLAALFKREDQRFAWETPQTW